MNYIPKLYSYSRIRPCSYFLSPTQAQTPQQNRPVTPVTASPTVNPVPGAYSPDIKVNYIRTWEALAPITDATVVTCAGYKDAKQTTSYKDGLGRPLQTVSRQSTRGAKDWVTPVVYDELGSEVFKYLPYASTENTGLFKPDPYNEQKSFMQSLFQDEQVYYNKTNHEASPLNRVLKTTARSRRLPI